MDEFEVLLRDCKNAVERFVHYKISSPSDAEDVFQDICLTAYKSFGQLKDRLSFKAWILSIARNKCSDYFRRKAKALEIPLDTVSETGFSCGRFGLTKTNMVRETLDLLSDRDRQILSLFYYRDLPQSDIAAHLGIPLGTVKSRLYHAKQNFKEKYPYPPMRKGDCMMKTLPEYLPEYTIEKSANEPFAVKWEELWGLFIVPKIGEKLRWGSYDTANRKLCEWSEMKVTSRAVIHGVDGVEIQEYRHDRTTIREYIYIAQLTQNDCRLLAEFYEKDHVKKHLTFLDGDEFLAEWGYGENNCGKKINICAKGEIHEISDDLFAQSTDQLFDIVGRYFVTIYGKSYDTVRIISLDSYYGQYTACEQYLDQNGRTVLWRRFNRDDWAIDRFQKSWSKQLPNNERLIINGETYVHWYDCITDYIL